MDETNSNKTRQYLYHMTLRKEGGSFSGSSTRPGKMLTPTNVYILHPSEKIISSGERINGKNEHEAIKYAGSCDTIVYYIIFRIESLS